MEYKDLIKRIEETKLTTVINTYNGPLQLILSCIWSHPSGRIFLQISG
jgi:hypothetical protein